MITHLARCFATGSLLIAMAGATQAESLLVCTVRIIDDTAPVSFSARLCAAAAEAADARQVKISEMKTILESPSKSGDETLLHVVEATLPSVRQISFIYSFGTAEEWNNQREARYDDLHIDMMDTELNSGSIQMFADTIRRLLP